MYHKKCYCSIPFGAPYGAPCDAQCVAPYGPPWCTRCCTIWCTKACTKKKKKKIAKRRAHDHDRAFEEPRQNTGKMHGNKFINTTLWYKNICIRKRSSQKASPRSPQYFATACRHLVSEASPHMSNKFRSPLAASLACFITSVDQFKRGRPTRRQ